jgi:hypothetical protein
MPFPFADIGTAIIAALGASSVIQRTRYAPGTRTAGVFVNGAPTTVSIDAVVQPVKPRELQQLPENERTEEAISIFSISTLQTSEPAFQQGDLITWAGRSYKVVLVEDWTAQANYSRSIATRKGLA